LSLVLCVLELLFGQELEELYLEHPMKKEGSQAYQKKFYIQKQKLLSQ